MGENDGMASEGVAVDPALLATFDVVQARDTAGLNGTSYVNERVAQSSRVYRYQLRDRALWHMRFERPIFSLATRSAGSILVSHVDNRFASDIAVDGDDGNLFCFTMMLGGHATLIHHGTATQATTDHGLAWRPCPGTRLSVDDFSARTNVFLKVVEVETALEHMLDQRLRAPLQFTPDLDWSHGLTASLKCHLDFMTREFQRSDGVAGNALALASATDLLLSLVLQGARHNYLAQFDRGSAGAAPIHVRRAEEFMRLNAQKPIRMAQVAAAAGCSVRTLSVVFKHFRELTPLAALQAIRLEQARNQLTQPANGDPIATVARRYGFTNATRFAAAFRRRYGQTPVEAVQRSSRYGSG
jgi:AraC-like DNA-binding protein